MRVYNGTAPIKRAAKEHRPQKDGFTLVFIGRMQPVKNHSLLLRAFAAPYASSQLASMDGRLWKRAQRLETLAANWALRVGYILGSATRRSAIFFGSRCLHHVFAIGGLAGVAATGFSPGCRDHDRRQRNGGGREVAHARLTVQ